MLWSKFRRIILPEASQILSNEHVFSWLLCSVAPQGILLAIGTSYYFFCPLGKVEISTKISFFSFRLWQGELVLFLPLGCLFFSLESIFCSFRIESFLDILAQVKRPVNSLFSFTTRWVNLYFLFLTCVPSVE